VITSRNINEIRTGTVIETTTGTKAGSTETRTMSGAGRRGSTTSIRTGNGRMTLIAKRMKLGTHTATVANSGEIRTNVETIDNGRE
jgi:hypothetical protein